MRPVRCQLRTCAGGVYTALVWCLIPVPNEYQAFAKFHIKTGMNDGSFVSGDTTRTIRRQNRSILLLARVLRKLNVPSLSLSALRDIQYRVIWLEKNLRIESPAPDVIRICLSGDRPHERQSIVDGVYEIFPLKRTLNNKSGVRGHRRATVRSDPYRSWKNELAAFVGVWVSGLTVTGLVWSLPVIISSERSTIEESCCCFQ